MSLIALSGYARSGKNAAAEALTFAGWELRAFADPLRAVLYAINPIVPGPDGAGTYRLAGLVDSYGWEHAKEAFPEIRQLLQRTGTEGGRKVLGENVWVDRAMAGVEGRAVVLADCRFLNEAQAVRAAGGLVFRIERPGVGPKTAPDGTVHPSETELDGFDFDAVIRNRGSLADLHRLLWTALDLHWGLL